MSVRNARCKDKDRLLLLLVPGLSKGVIKNQLHDLFYSNFGFNPHVTVSTQPTTKKS